MEKDVKEILLSGIEMAFRDLERDKVCRIFIPNDTRMFDKFSRTLKKVMLLEWEQFEQRWMLETRIIMEEDWFARFLHYQMVAQELYHYALGNETNGLGEREFLEALEIQTKQYAAECGDEMYSVRKMLKKWQEREQQISGTKNVVQKEETAGSETGESKEDTQRLSEDAFRRLNEAEGRMILDFYGMIIKVVRQVVEEITPKADSRRIDQMTGTEEEVRRKVLYNLEHEKLENDEMWWHIRYCIDHEVTGCGHLMVNLARNGQWKAWVRQAAVEYCCRYMNEEEVCEKLLSGLYGKLFYWSVVQLADSQEERLKTVLDNYAEYYTGQEILRDACFVKLQDREAVKRIYRYLARMRRAPAILENPDPVFVIGDIRRVELLEELGKFLDLMIRDKFRDRKWNGLQVSLVSALTRIASNNQQEKDMVQNLLEEKLDYCWRQWWKARCLDLQNQKEAYITKEEPAPHMTQQNDGVSEIMWGLNKKFIACICLAEDVRWRIARKTDLVHGKE